MLCWDWLKCVNAKVFPALSSGSTTCFMVQWILQLDLGYEVSSIAGISGLGRLKEQVPALLRSFYTNCTSECVHQPGGLGEFLTIHKLSLGWIQIAVVLFGHPGGPEPCIRSPGEDNLPWVRELHFACKARSASSLISSPRLLPHFH